MGTTTSQQIIYDDFHPDQWQVSGEKQITFGKSKTLKNKNTGALIDEYHLSWNNYKQYQFYMKSFYWRNRKKNQSPVVNSLYFRQICKKQICSNKYSSNIYLEYIPMRLSQLQDIPISDTLFILFECLEGFMQLYQHSGYFRINDEQICIDRIGKVKVWVNSNLSKNYPECDNECQRNVKDETHMVDQLIKLMNDITDRDQMPQICIRQHFNIIMRRQNTNIGFQYAKVILIQYAKIYNLKISNRFDSYIEIRSHHLIGDNRNHLHQNDQINQSQNLSQQPFMNDISTVRLNQSYSMPNIHDERFSHSYSYPHPRPTIINSQPIYYPMPIHHPSYWQNIHPYIHQQPMIKPPQLTQTYPSQFLSTNQQTKRKSKNSKSQMVCMETTQNHSLNFNQEQVDDRNTMKSMPLGHYSSTHRDRLGAYPRYSQCVQEINSEYQSNYYKYFNNDGFGLSSRPRKMKQSTSSYKMASSNSSQSKYYRNEQRFSKKSSKKSISSKKQSAYNQKLDYYDYYQRNNNIRYFTSLNEQQYDLDPEIQADIRRYFG